MNLGFHPSNKVLVALGRTAKEYGLKAGVRFLQLAAKTKTTSAESGKNKVSVLKIIAATIISTAIFIGSSVSGDEPVKLFNGKDLTGWTGADYEVNDGKLICRGKVLRTEKQYSDYILEFDFLLPPRGNNGLGIHYPGQGRPSGAGMELQILDNSHPKYSKLKTSQYHGSLYKLQPAKRGFLNPVGEWNHQKVTVHGAKVLVELNGKTILDANLDELMSKYPKHKGVKRRTGYICFCGHGDPVQFKNITIMELSGKSK